MDVCEYAVGVVGTASRKLHPGSVEKCRELPANSSPDPGCLFGKMSVFSRSTERYCALAGGRGIARSAVGSRRKVLRRLRDTAR